MVTVFLYGSFMSPQVLRDRGLTREVPPLKVALLEGFDIILSPSATVIPSTKDIVYGVLAELTNEELDLLYSQDWLTDYKPRPVIVRGKDGREVAALCYVAPPRPNTSPKPDYVTLLIETATAYGFPSWYIERLRNAGRT